SEEHDYPGIILVGVYERYDDVQFTVAVEVDDRDLAGIRVVGNDIVINRRLEGAVAITEKDTHGGRAYVGAASALTYGKIYFSIVVEVFHYDGNSRVVARHNLSRGAEETTGVDKYGYILTSYRDIRFA